MYILHHPCWAPLFCIWENLTCSHVLLWGKDIHVMGLLRHICWWVVSRMCWSFPSFLIFFFNSPHTVSSQTIHRDLALRPLPCGESGMDTTRWHEPSYLQLCPLSSVPFLLVVSVLLSSQLSLSDLAHKTGYPVKSEFGINNE